MSKVELLLEEIQHLPQNELEVLAKEIFKRLERLQRVQAMLMKIQGAGKGLWEGDAQVIINKLREDR